MTTNTEEMSFEGALQELESVVAQLESGDLTLEASIGLFEQGQVLAKRCVTQLEEATLRVEQLTQDGEIIEL